MDSVLHSVSAPASAAPSLPAAARMGAVTLRVADAARAARFYRAVVGLRDAAPVNGLPALAAGGRALVILKETPRALPVPRGSGLYHFALLVPSRRALGNALARLDRAGVRIGAADHLVSEALYLSDPDGNGIEIYRDRPRSEWRWEGGVVAMATDPLDLDALLRDGEANGADNPMADGTTMGHLHLQVSDVPQAVRFYRDLVGFDVTAQWHGAAFLSAGGYHHHLGLNSWQTRGAAPVPAGASGLERLTLLLPSAAQQAALVERLSQAGIPVRHEDGATSVRDPWNIGVDIVVDEGGEE